jgi:MoaA/NifB/PqqE/SkfB family radical SAM enzyme
LPLDGSTEEVNKRTKEEDHLTAVIKALEWLREYPEVDVKVCTPVTRHNLADVPNIARLVENYARTTEARVFYNIFQAFPRAMFEVEWDELLVSDEEFAELKKSVRNTSRLRINFLEHATLDRLYMMIFPDGRLVIPCGREFPSYGPFLEIEDIDTVLEKSRFAWERHLRHSRGWVKNG